MSELLLDPYSTKDVEIDGCKFRIRPLTAREKLSIFPDFRSIKEDAANSDLLLPVETLTKVVKAGLVGFNDDTPWDTDMDVNIDRIEEPSTLIKLMTEILTMSRVSDEQAKNS